MIRMKVREIVKQTAFGFKELLFPGQPICPACQQEPSYYRGLGKNCLTRIGFIQPPYCHKCGRSQRLEAAKKANLCKQCINTRYYFNQARSVAMYEGALREYLAEIKYRYRPDLGAALGELLVEWLKLNRGIWKIDCIVPIPIHPQKLAVRGYNQAELLSKPLNKYLGISEKHDIIIRDRMTESQNALEREERFANIAGAFRVTDASTIRNTRILLIDDIFTTGATVSEASRILLRAGALEVNVLTLAAGSLDTEWTT